MLLIFVKELCESRKSILVIRNNVRGTVLTDLKLSNCIQGKRCHGNLCIKYHFNFVCSTVCVYLSGFPFNILNGIHFVALIIYHLYHLAFMIHGLRL